MLGEACMKEMTKSYIGECVTTLGIGDTMDRLPLEVDGCRLCIQCSCEPIQSDVVENAHIGLDVVL